ncbi:hypothetical protein [Xenorhabdus hominickii]|uniref:Structural protein n=1 Tax=Xenorhabdus hominickii TaxID=351679 RepID=A0A2G0Q135_XENHO|nr:hypothetical protein [Xenorhabdus hominickii]AOM40491.1 hypothetical protein A9255_07785 [Xenorhabdus hominickii]PHM52939.1 structural protein [Xenorhabdus hominickii]
MANVFDFQLNADENVTKTIAEMEMQLKSLRPSLAGVREELRFGGSETLDNVGAVSNKLRDMSQFAKDNVQHIGAIIPPLKNVGELTAKYGGLAKKYGGIVGGVGAIGYGATKLYQSVRDAGKEAITRSTRAKNSGMSVADFTRMSGAMQLSTGAAMDEADQSVESLYPVLQNALTIRNSATKAELNKIGVEIAKNKNDNADVYQTMKNLAAEWNNIVPETQNTLREHLGLDANTLSFLRDGGRKINGKFKIEELLSKSDAFGLTKQDKDNEQIEKLGERINEVEARAAGALREFRGDMLLTGFGQWDKAKEVAKDKNSVHGFFAGAAAFANPFGFNHGGDQLALLKKAKKDDEFRRTLSFKEKTDLLLEYASEDLIKKLNAYYFPNEKPSHVGEKVPDMSVVKTPDYPNPNQRKKNGKTTRGERNKNPGNLRAASNAIGRDGPDPENSFVQFRTMEDGLSAMSRQLMLYGDRGINTLNRIIHKYAPIKDKNNTFGYIDFVSKRTGINPNERLNMHEPELIERLMKAMIFKESEMQFSPEELQRAIMASIHDPRWAGLRANHHLQNQRMLYGSNGQEQPLPSLYSQNRQTEYDEETIKKIALAIQEAIGDKTITVDINLVNDNTGERQRFQTKTAGKITTSMQYP